MKKKNILLTCFIIALILLIVLIMQLHDDTSTSSISRQTESSSQNSQKLENDTGKALEKKEERPDIFSEIWSQYSPNGKGYEYKVNCGSNYTFLETCFLWSVENVTVFTPLDENYSLKKDFNINTYSGEITRRWVLYGPENSSLPVSGNYRFEFIRNGSLVFIDLVNYTQSMISYPTAVIWERRGKDLFVRWQAPRGMQEEMWYKVILWNEYGTPQTFVSQQFPSTALQAILKDVPLIEQGNYSLNVAVFYRGGYAYSEYSKLKW